MLENKNNIKTIEVCLGSNGHNGVYEKFSFDDCNNVHALVSGSAEARRLFIKTMTQAIHNKYLDDLLVRVLDTSDLTKGLPEYIKCSNECTVESLVNDLSELNDILIERGREMLGVGCTTINAYNDKCPNKSMKKLLLIVNVNDSRDLWHIIKTLESVLRLGRTRGVHVVLLAPSFKDELPKKHLVFFNTRFVFKSTPVESELLLGTDIASKLKDPVRSAYVLDCLPTAEFCLTKLDFDYKEKVS